jgi:hypothetical protein
MDQESAESRPAPSETQARASRTRGIAAKVLLGLFCLFVPFSVTAIWARNQVFDTDRYVATVDGLAADPVIQEAAATRTANAIFERVDLGSRIAEVLPGDQRILLGPVTEAVQEWATNEIEMFFASDEWQQIWNEVNRAAHDALVAVLTGEGRGALDVEGGQVTLDLSPLVAKIEARLGERGLDIFDRVTSGEPINAEIVILDSPELAEARKAADLLDRFALVLALVVVALLIGYFVLAPSKRKALIRAGLALAVSMTVFLGLLAIGRAFYLNGVDPESRREVATVFFDTLLGRLRDGSRALILLGLVVAAVGFLLGFAGRVRIPRPTGAGVWVGAHRTILSASVVAVACLLLILSDRPSTAAVAWITLIAAGLLIAIWLFSRQPPAIPQRGEAAAD